MRDGLPFYLKQEHKSKAVIICLHGFFATTYETRPIANACLALGIDAVAPLLPSHGYAELADQKRAVLNMNLEDLLIAIRQEVSKARLEYEYVGIYGQSMGGALALAIASEGLVDVVATTAPALLLPIWSRVLIALLGWWSSLFLEWNPAKQAFYNSAYTFANAHATVELQKIAQYTCKLLNRIHCPIYVAHSHRDRLIDPIVCQWIENQVPGKVKVEWFDRSDHIMPLDVQGAEVSRAIANYFIEQLRLSVFG